MALQPMTRWSVSEEYQYESHHQWFSPQEGVIKLGVTDYTQDTAGEILYVSLPEPGTMVRKGQPCGSIESGKWVGQVYAPCDGTVLAVNDRLQQEPQLVNQDPYGAGWMMEISPFEMDAAPEGMTPAEYRVLLAPLDDGIHA